eukprot:NODE_210_length_14612_cov_0.470957.p1 type:complete len:2117 gc:universal NODE_210_length_14612_cov_0.470957:12713-6363(-)
MLSLKINLTSHGKTKTMQFPGNIAIHTIIQKIKEETGLGEDHALYDPDRKKWLKLEKTLFYYDIPSNHVLEFKKKHRALKLKMLDGSLKTVLIDESLTVQQLVDFCCDKLTINNPEEFSIGVDLDLDTEKLKKDKDKDVSNLTDGAFRWLNPDQALCEQGITADDILTLKKKFYVSDQNVDRNDPVQLNLVYTQARNQIITEKHPCTLEEAIQFAAIQCQVQTGNHDPNKHKPGFLELKDYLPGEYLKSKDVEKRIYSEHSKLSGLNDLNAKYRYVQLSRSLRTYGVTFYLVKEKTKKKGVLEPVLMGITKEKIMRFDVRTKEVIHSWPLTTLRRWAATPNSLTLDFGDHSDAYYTVQTAEGDVISQLIGGYIDIILKKRRDGDRKIDEGTEESAMVESIQRAPKMEQANMLSFKEQKAQFKALGGNSVNQLRTPMQTVAQVVKVGYAQHQTASIANNKKNMQAEMSSFDAVQQHLQSGYAAINSACVELQYPSAIQPMDTSSNPDAANWKKDAYNKHASAINARMVKHVESVAILLNQTVLNKNNLDLDIVGGAIYTLSSNLSQLAAEAKMIGCFAEDTSVADKILEITRKIGSATAEWLLACQQALEGENSNSDLYKIAQIVADASDELITALGLKNGSLEDAQYVLGAAQQINVEFSNLMEGLPTIPDQIKSALALLKIGTVHLLSVSKVVLPMLDVQECTSQAIYAAKQASEHCNSLMSEDLQDESFVTSCQSVKSSIDRLISILDGDTNNPNKSDKIQHLLALTIQANQLSYDPDLLLSKIKEITIASSEMAQLITLSINQSNDPKEIERLKHTAKDLAKKTSELVQETRKWTKDPDNDDLRIGVLKSLGKLQQSAKLINGDTRETALQTLSEMAQKLILNTSALLNSCSGAALSNTNSSNQKQLMQAARKTFLQNSDLAASVMLHNSDPLNVAAQLKLIHNATDSIKFMESLTKAIKTAIATIGDPSIKKSIVDSSERVDDSILKLQSALGTISCFGDIGGPEHVLDGALGTFQTHLNEITAICKDLSLLDKENVLGDLSLLQEELKVAAKTSLQELIKLKQFSNEGNDQGTCGCAVEIVNSFNRVTLATKQIAAIIGLERWNSDTVDSNVNQLLSELEASLRPCIEVIQIAKRQLNKKHGLMQPEINQFAAQMSKLQSHLPEQLQLLQTIELLEESLRNLGNQANANNGASKGSVANVFQSATQMSNAYNVLLNSKQLPFHELLRLMNDFAKHQGELTSSCLSLSGELSPDEQKQLYALLKDISDSTSAVFACSKRQSSTLIDDSDLKEQMSNVNSMLNTQVQELLHLISNAGNREETVDNGVQITLKQTVEKCLEMIKNANQISSVQNEQYGDVVKSLVNSINKLVKTLEQPLTTKQQLETTSKDTEAIAVELAGLISKSIMMIALSDFDTIPGEPGLVDVGLQDSYKNKLREKIEQLANSKTPQEIALTTAEIAKLTNVTMQLCKEMANDKTGRISPEDQQYFMQYAQYIQQSVQQFVQAVKLYSTNMSDVANKDLTISHANGILEGVSGIITYLRSPQFSGTPTQFSSKSIINIKPVLDVSRKIYRALDNASNSMMLLGLNPGNSNVANQINNSSKQIKDAKTGLLRALDEQSPLNKKMESQSDKLQNLLIDLDATLLKCATDGLVRVDANENQTVDAVNVLLDLIEAEKSIDATFMFKLIDEFEHLNKQLLAEASIKDNKSKQVDMVQLLKDLTESILDLHTAIKDGNDTTDDKSKVVARLNAISSYWESSSVLDQLINQSKDQIVNHQNSIITDYNKVSGAIVPLASFLNECRELIMSISSLAGFIGKDQSELHERIPMIPVRLLNMQQSLQIALKVAETSTKSQIDSNIKLLCLGLTTYLSMLGNCVMRPMETSNKSSLNAASRDVSSRVGLLITSVKNANPGLSQTETAVSHINENVMNQIESTLVFAEAGQFEPMQNDKKFKDVHEDIQKGVKRLMEDVKGIISATATSMNSLGEYSDKSAKHLEEVWVLSKSAIASITSADKLTQIELLKSAALMSSSMNELISTAMQVCGRPQNDPEFTSTLPLAAKKAAQQIAQFYKSVESVSDDKTRALKAINAVMGNLRMQEDLLMGDSHGIFQLI